MDTSKNEQTEISAHIAEANGVKGEGETTVSFGKFKDAAALFSAYNSLQSEFTKRCQRIKELEAEVSAAAKNAVADNPERADTGITESEKENLLKGYLREILDGKSKAIVMDGLGTSVKTPAYRPKTVEEAGKLAKEMLAKQ